MSSSRRRWSIVAAQPEQEVDDLAARQARPQADVAGDVGEATVQRDAVGPRVAAEHGDRTPVVPEQAEQNADRHRLAGAVGSEEAVDLAAFDLEIESVERRRSARTS